MTAKHFAFVGNTASVQLVGLQSAIDDSYINDATVTMTLVDSEGAEVAGESWPITLFYVADSDGVYRSTFSHDAALVDRDYYEATITATLPSGDVGKWVEPMQALERSRESQLQTWWPE